MNESNSKTTHAGSAASSCAPSDPGPDLRPVEGPEADDELARFAKALAHPARVQMMRILSHRETCRYGDLADSLPLAQSTVSQHLKILKEAALIRGEVEGPRVCYCIDWRTLRRLKALFSAL